MMDESQAKSKNIDALTPFSRLDKIAGNMSVISRSLILLSIISMCFGASQPKARAAKGGGSSRRATIGRFDNIVPLVLNGNGFKTSITLNNLDRNIAYIDLFILNEEGNLLEVPIAGIGPVSRLYGSIPVHGSIVIETDGTGPLVEGYVSFFVLDRDPSADEAQIATTKVGSTTTVERRGGDSPAFETSFAAAPVYESRFSLPFDERGDTKTMAILINGSTKSSPINMKIRDTEGKVLAEDSFTLEPDRRIAAILRDQYPGMVGFSGVVEVSTSSMGLTGQGIRLSPEGTFSAVQTLSGGADPSDPVAPTVPPATSLPGVGSTCSSIEGSLIFAHDGTYLGKITSNAFDVDSIGNPYGRYGSSYSVLSIFNQYGTYGGQYAALSPFNPYTTTPPLIVLDSNPLAYLTANASLKPGVPVPAIYPCIGKE